MYGQSSSGGGARIFDFAVVTKMEKQMNTKQIKIIKNKRRNFWFKHNQDAPGYGYGDNRAMGPSNVPLDLKREIVRRTWNF